MGHEARLISIGALVALALGACDQVVQGQLDDIHSKVADDAVAQYEITKGSGGPIDRCVQAGMVVAAFLQAKDEAEYKRWKLTQKIDCLEAGLPN